MSSGNPTGYKRVVGFGSDVIFRQLGPQNTPVNVQEAQDSRPDAKAISSEREHLLTLSTRLREEYIKRLQEHEISYEVVKRPGKADGLTVRASSTGQRASFFVPLIRHLVLSHYLNCESGNSLTQQYQDLERKILAPLDQACLQFTRVMESEKGKEIEPRSFNKITRTLLSRLRNFRVALDQGKIPAFLKKFLDDFTAGVSLVHKVGVLKPELDRRIEYFKKIPELLDASYDKNRYSEIKRSARVISYIVSKTLDYGNPQYDSLRGVTILVNHDQDLIRSFLKEARPCISNLKKNLEDPNFIADPARVRAHIVQTLRALETMAYGKGLHILRDSLNKCLANMNVGFAQTTMIGSSGGIAGVQYRGI